MGVEVPEGFLCFFSNSVSLSRRTPKKSNMKILFCFVTIMQHIKRDQEQKGVKK